VICLLIYVSGLVGLRPSDFSTNDAFEPSGLLQMIGTFFSCGGAA
jgi:hypothetical protein